MFFVNPTTSLTKLFEGADPQQKIICARCHNPLSSPQFILSILGSSATHCFVNPAGQRFTLITLSHCERVLTLDPAVLEATWFDGYSWRILLCTQCHDHLGWQYQGENLSPSYFYGLITDKITLSKAN